MRDIEIRTCHSRCLSPEFNTRFFTVLVSFKNNALELKNKIVVVDMLKYARVLPGELPGPGSAREQFPPPAENDNLLNT